MKIRSVLVIGLIGLSASCTSISPVKVTAGEQCYRCRRTITDERMAGEMIAGTFVSKFRAPGCMAKYLVEHPTEQGTLFVTDFTTGKMIDPQQAYFVSVIVNENTGERDYRAYRLKNVADLSAQEQKTTAIDWQSVLDRARS